jgi:hypothetical protein
MFSLRQLISAVAVAALALAASAQGALAQSHTSKVFTGAKVTVGTVTHARQGGKDTLTLSDDFKVPDTPDPHWQIVDSKGQVFLLQRLNAKGLAGDRLNRTITVPSFIKDIAKVQIYCAWAEALLGETTFDTSLTLTH